MKRVREDADKGTKMNELCDTKEMVERLKDTISIPLGERKVFDRHVAWVLGVTQENLATMKKRNSPPLKEILLFCNRCGLDPMKIVMKCS